ncbi:MAG: hypothetical protein KC910_14160 [Candidatus Eremiobacteraeota bacterium]|nr:hypothetical protein [Candidatus Eremiobacteraeota bacterium]
MANAAVNMIQAEQLRKRIDELTERQERLMDELVAMHPDPSVRDRFEALSSKIEELKIEIRGCNDMEDLKELEGKIESTVESWVHHFQIIVAGLMGAPPPSGPIFQ